MSDDEEIAKNADWLRRIANDLRAAGDVSLVHMDGEGVGPAGVTLADELWLVALMLDRAIGKEVL